MKEISINEFDNVRIGSAENTEAATGCTVFIFENGATAGIDIRGGGPASREVELLKPTKNAPLIHAILLGGGSAYGLDAGGGVMEFLEEKGIGLDVGVAKVPLVCQSDLFDLTVATHKIRPDKAMGHKACENAWDGNYRDGNFGAGCGASVGKLLGMDYCMKSGIGYYGVQIGELKLGAVVAVNALGDIYDAENGRKIAGLLTEDKKGFRSSEEILYSSYEVVENKFTGNTTLGVILTNGKFDKTQLCKIAQMTHNGYARCIRPVHTTADGDSVYAVSLGNIPADQDMVGTLAADVMTKAIKRAVMSAESAYGLIAAKDL